jgi:E3 ubiquitin-protein ligase SIAH1
MMEAVKSSSLLDGLPKEYFCIVPHASDRSSPVMLRTTIDIELVYDEVDDELEDESYDDDEADNSDDD